MLLIWIINPVVRESENRGFLKKPNFQKVIFIFYGEHSSKMGEQLPNRAKARRTRAKVRRTRAKARRTRAGNFQKRRRAIFLGELCAFLLHPILTLFILRPIGLEALPNKIKPLYR